MCLFRTWLSWAPVAQRLSWNCSQTVAQGCRFTEIPTCEGGVHLLPRSHTWLLEYLGALWAFPQGCFMTWQLMYPRAKRWQRHTHAYTPRQKPNLRSPSPAIFYLLQELCQLQILRQGSSGENGSPTMYVSLIIPIFCSRINHDLCLTVLHKHAQRCHR